MRTFTVQGIAKPCSQLVLGSIAFLHERLDESFALLDTFVELGGTAVDLAKIYNGGDSERVFGQWLRARGARDHILIVTKGAHHDADGSRVNPQAIREDLASSLDRMAVDQVDLYMLHRDDVGVPVGEIVDALDEQKQKGLIRAVGVSNWTIARIDEANEYAKNTGRTPIVANSPNLSLAVPLEPRWPGCVHADDATRAWHRANQMPLLSWSSQAGGFFTGRFSPDDRSDPNMVRTYYSEDNWERYRRARELGARRGFDANQVALAFVLGQPFPVGALIGPMTVEELKSSYRAVELELSSSEMAWLDLR